MIKPKVVPVKSFPERERLERRFTGDLSLEDFLPIYKDVCDEHLNVFSTQSLKLRCMALQNELDQMFSEMKARRSRVVMWSMVELEKISIDVTSGDIMFTPRTRHEHGRHPRYPHGDKCSIYLGQCGGVDMYWKTHHTGYGMVDRFELRYGSDLGDYVSIRRHEVAAMESLNPWFRASLETLSRFDDLNKLIWRHPV